MLDEQQTFLRRIREMPECDHLRMIYADWLDDHPFLACTCDDGSQDTGASTPWGEWISIRCPMCKGTGNLHHGFAERAAFIRVQVELSQVKPKECKHDCHSEGPPGSYCTTCCHAPECCNCDLHELVRWPLIQKQRQAFEAKDLDLAGETGDWFRLIGDSKVIQADYIPGEFTTRFKANFRRGFVDEIECTVGQWMGFGPCSGCAGRGWNRVGGPIPEQEQCEICDGRGTQPAIGPLVVANQPVMKVKFTDRTPYHIGRMREPHGRYYLWREIPHDGQEEAVIPPALYALLPDPVLGSMGPGNRGWMWFDGEDSANAAISTAAILWAKAQPSERAADAAVSSTSLA